MKMNNYGDDGSDRLNSEYVVLQTKNMNISNKANFWKFDSLALLLEESESVTNFRRYLDSINSGHFLDFWFACQGFKNFDKSDSHKLNQLMKVIYKAYIKSESPFSVPLKTNTKKSIVDKLNVRKIFDPTIFDTAQSEIREILAGEFLLKFFKSEFYTDSNILDRDSLNSVNNLQLSDAPASGGSSTGYISRKSMGAKNMGASRSYDAISDGCSSKNPLEITTVQIGAPQGPVISGTNNQCSGFNASGNSLKDRRNLSEIDPPAFAKILCSRLEEVFVEQTNFDRMLRLVKSVPNESDTDDSHSSAISYLMKCQWYNSQSGHCCSIDGDVNGDTGAILASISGAKTKAGCHPGDGCGSDIRDEYAQGILESHCSRIGVERNEGTPVMRRDDSEVRAKWGKDNDLGSTTSYDSGVATSLGQRSGVPIPSDNLLGTLLQWHKDSSKSGNQIDARMEQGRYHHHHHHHHHKNHNDTLSQKDFLAVNNISDVSSNFDSGISSTYENFGRRFQPMDDKVSNWMSKHPKVTSKTSYKYNEYSQSPKITSCMPPNTPQISSRGIHSLSPPPPNDPFTHQSYLLSRFNAHNQRFSPLPESGILPCQNIEYWLEQQDSSSHDPLARLSDNRYHNYCSSTVGCAGSELVLRDDTGIRDQKINQPLNKVLVPTKEPQNNSQILKAKPPGPLVIGYYIGNDPVPYRTQIPDAQQITLGQFKSLIAKKGPFRYFFKRYCDEFECGVVHEEITKDDAILPLWEGKVVAKIEKSD